MGDRKGGPAGERQARLLLRRVAETLLWMHVLAVRTFPGQSHSSAERDTLGINAYAKTNDHVVRRCRPVRFTKRVIPVGGDDTWYTPHPSYLLEEYFGTINPRKLLPGRHVR